MKRLINKKILLGSLSIFFCLLVSAQEFRSDKSISEQLKSNSVATLSYAPTTNSVVATKTKGFEGSSLLKQIKEGKFAMPVDTENGSVANKPQQPNQKMKALLTSEVSETERKAEADAGKLNTQQTKTIPTQEENSTGAGKKE